MKSLLRLGLIVLGLAAGTAASASGMCEDSNRKEVCYKMRHLRAGINALDAQRELMQMDPAYFIGLGMALKSTAEETRKIIGIGIPEHHQGLSGVAFLGNELAAQAAMKSTDMLRTANLIRNQCATCHSARNPAGGVDWDGIFNMDWSVIVEHCNKAERNPYLCRSMNGMLSAYGYLLTAYEAKTPDYVMTRLAADEVVRILVDLKEKGFHHLPEELRAKAQTDAENISQMAEAKNPEVFKVALTMTNACQECHQRTSSGPGGYEGFDLGRVNWKK